MDKSRRLRLIIKRIKEIMQKDNTTIICLQEVSYEWVGIITNYCKEHNLWFFCCKGNGILWDRSIYYAEEMNLVTVSMNKRYKINQYTEVQFYQRQQRKRFVVISTHLCLFSDGLPPRDYWKPMMDSWAERAKKIPVIIAADCNFKPRHEAYKYITTATGFKSAYGQTKAGEPVYTQKSWNSSKKKTIGHTVDYIFNSGELKVKCVDKLATDERVYYPNKYEPSDHLMIGATLCYP